MPAPELKTQVPGENPTADSAPDAPNYAELTALAELTVDEITSGFEALNDAELAALHEIEKSKSQPRVTLLRAIEAEFDARAAANPSTPPADAPVDLVVRTDRQPTPVLTDAGWVVPEPALKP